MKENGASVAKEIVSFAVIALFIVLPLRMFVAQPFIVSGESMLPTFESGQYLIVDQLSYHFHEPKRGDVVIFKYPKDETKFFIKRVVGLPGERVKISDSHVTIFNDENPDGLVLDEPYILYTRNDMSEVTLAEDEFFVLGDNRFSSSDSRIWGPLKRDLIVGRAYVRLLPIEKIDLLPGNISL